MEGCSFVVIRVLFSGIVFLYPLMRSDALYHGRSILLDCLLTVKVAPHECVIRTSQL